MHEILINIMNSLEIKSIILFIQVSLGQPILFLIVGSITLFGNL